MAVLLREWRERRGLSLHKLAEKAGVSYVTIVRIEQERMSPTVAMLEKLAKALGISVQDFFPKEARGGKHGARKRKGQRRL